jgi:hypothetical protein
MATALSVLKCLAFRLEAPAGWCDEMAKYPNPTNHLRPACGHYIPEEQPDLLAETIATFFAEETEPRSLS